MEKAELKVIPGILEKDFAEIEKKLKVLSSFTDTVHIDFIDGKFADNTTVLDPSLFKPYADSLFLEAHLMVEEPINYLEDLARSGFKRFIGQVEKMSSQAEFVVKAQNFGEVGIALDGQTPLSAIDVSLEDLDILLFMAISAGFSGQDFTPAFLEKLKNLEGVEFLPIEIDGGINEQTIVAAKNFGANVFVANSFIFGKPDPDLAFEKLNSLVQPLM